MIFGDEADNCLSVKLKPAPADPTLERINQSRKMVRFNGIETNGAFRFLKDKKMIIPLPESQSFDVVINLSDLKISRIEALDENLKRQEDIEYSIDNGHLHFVAKSGFFAYRLVE